MPAEDALRTRVLTLLEGRGAHVAFEDATEHLPADLRGKRPETLPYSSWELVEHLRTAQRDILDYCRPGDYEQPDWPSAYWPPTPAPPSTNAWEDSCVQVAADRRTLQQIVGETSDLHAPVPHATEEAHTYLREALLVADHTSYHVGQLVVVRRLLNCWPPSEEE